MPEIVEAAWITKSHTKDAIRRLERSNTALPRLRELILFSVIPLAYSVWVGDAKVISAYVLGLACIAIPTRIVSRVCSRFFASNGRDLDPNDPAEIGTVWVLLRFKGQTYARDLGFVTIDDQFLHFEGLSTEFSLSARKLRRNRRDFQLDGLGDYSFRFQRHPMSPKDAIERLEARLCACEVDQPLDFIPATPPLRPRVLSAARLRVAKIAVDMVFELLIVAVAICALFSIGTVTTAAVVAAIAIVMLPINQYFRHRVEILLELHNRFVDRA